MSYGNTHVRQSIRRYTEQFFFDTTCMRFAIQLTKIDVEFFFGHSLTFWVNNVMLWVEV